jgi:glycosyltransferase involved in cell wall biosynthesis
MKLCYVLSYRDPRYTRTASLLAALGHIDGIEIIEVRNRRLGLLRYPETLWKLFRTRLVHKPDVFLLGFRGHEIFPFVRLITWRRPLVFDEFINLYEWVVEERGHLAATHPAARLIRAFSAACVHRAELVITDTPQHLAYTAAIHDLDTDRLGWVYVGADEATFVPVPHEPDLDGPLTVLFYGNMHPLHGIDVILDAAEILRALPVRFTIIGGRGTEVGAGLERRVRAERLTNVSYEDWVDYDELPSRIASADVCLAGPFGGTVQARHVITGKAFQFAAMAKPMVVGALDGSFPFTAGVDSIVIEQGSAPALASALRWCLDHRADLPAIGREGRALYEREFSSVALAERLAALLLPLRATNPGAA